MLPMQPAKSLTRAIIILDTYICIPIFSTIWHDLVYFFISEVLSWPHFLSIFSLAATPSGLIFGESDCNPPQIICNTYKPTSPQITVQLSSLRFCNASYLRTFPLLSKLLRGFEIRSLMSYSYRRLDREKITSNHKASMQEGSSRMTDGRRRDTASWSSLCANACHSDSGMAERPFLLTVTFSIIRPSGWVTSRVLIQNSRVSKGLFCCSVKCDWWLTNLPAIRWRGPKFCQCQSGQCINSRWSVHHGPNRKFWQIQQR